MNYRKNIFIKKSVRYFNDVVRNLRVPFLKKESFIDNPPIIVNSFPKSGTHLLMQIVEAIPKTTQYGNFIASTPSFTFRETQPQTLKRKVNKLLPGEIVGAHLFYSDIIRKALKEMKCFHLFIYRDLRDVTISEAHYLSSMNRWHKLSPFFKKLNTDLDRVKLSLYGLNHPNIDYPNIIERFAKYKKWIDCEEVISIKYEDLMSEKKIEIIENIAVKYKEHSKNKMPLRLLKNRMIDNIDPKKSHTFRSGKTNQWEKQYTFEMKNDFEKMMKRLQK